MNPLDTQNNTQPQQLDQDVVNLAKALRQVESGNNPNAKGKSGEYGAYQFTVPTWKNYAQKHIGNPNADINNPLLQNEVAYKQLKQWKDQGFNVGQIASMWNAGEGKPNAYIEGNKGVNQYGAEYDTKDYARKVAQTYQQLKGQTANTGGFNPTPFSSGAVKVDVNATGQEKPVGLIQGLIQHAASPFTGALSTTGALLNRVTGNEERAQQIENQGVDYGYFGKQKPIGAGFDVTKGVSENKGPLLDVLDKGATAASDILTAQSLYGGAKNLLSGVGKSAFNPGSALGTEQVQSTVSKLAGEGAANLSKAELQNTLTQALSDPSLEPSVRSVLEAGLKEATQMNLAEAGISSAPAGWSGTHPLLSGILKVGKKGLGAGIHLLAAMQVLQMLGKGNQEGISNTLKTGVRSTYGTLNDLTK